VTLKVALTLAPGATGAVNDAGPEATAVHPAGTKRLRRSPDTGMPVLFLNVTVVKVFAGKDGAGKIAPVYWQNLCFASFGKCF
jgi:hypothetical protein